jgi:PAS domain S-box-containing protein
MSSHVLPAKAEQLFRYLFEQASLGIAVEDLDGKILVANPALSSMLGYREDELAGMNCCQFANSEDSRDERALFQQLRAGLIDHYTLEKRYVTKQGAPLWGSLIVSLLKTEDGGSPLIFAFVKDITESKQTEAALANVSRKLIEAQEQERTRIGRELHDDIGQRLALVAIELRQLRKDAVAFPRVRSRIGELQKKVSQVAADIQSLSHELHSARLRYLGAAAAMRGLCREFGEQQRVKVEFKANNLPTALSADISLCLFRVLQEALHNSAKHSGAHRLEVRMWGNTNEIYLTVKDSGKGFDRDAAKTSQGLGLISMEERLKVVNGTLSVDSQPGRGTIIEARIPVSSEADSVRAVG